ncbi:hypothetical protein FIB12_20950 [Klebsiella pneumoniae]
MVWRSPAGNASMIRCSCCSSTTHIRSNWV